MRISDWSADVCSSDLVEDDYHCMRVTLHHDGMIATRIEPELLRAPWTTCPGASAQLVETFTGVALADFPARGDKPLNCTHLPDFALLAAVHTAHTPPLGYYAMITHSEVGRTTCRERGS